MQPLIEPTWKGHRLVASHFPPIDLFESIYDTEEELRIAFELEGMTNSRLVDDMQGFPLIRNGDCVSGPGTTPIMAAFSHIGFPSRFCDGKYGVYYCAENTETAIRETIHHKERWLASTNEGDTELTMREYITDITKPLFDAREDEAVHDPNSDDYSVSQSFGNKLYKDKHWGILYQSVRNPGNECAAILRPPALSNCTQAGHYRYVWNGQEQRIVGYFKINETTFVEI